jgi:hypothetical protein
MAGVIRASCLCGSVRWSVAGPLPPMYHCHCSRCRKAHGAAFATYVDAPVAAVTLVGLDAIATWPTEVEGARRFCRTCGSVAPYAHRDTLFLPAGNFDGDPGTRPARHIFAASRAPWYPICDALPQSAAYAPDRTATPEPDSTPADRGGRPGGGCLCGAVAYVLDGPPIKRRYCHCGRCRKALSAAHAANLRTSADAVRFTRGEERLAHYRLPEARSFTTGFCSQCGSPQPTRHRDRGIALVPLGSFDDDPGVPALGHIFVGSKAPWFDIADDLPRYEEYPPGG